MLFCFQTFGCFKAISVLLTSALSIMIREPRFHTSDPLQFIEASFFFLRSISVNGQYAQKNLCSLFVGYKVLYYLIAQIYYCVQAFDITAYFCLLGLSRSESGGLKSPALIVNVSISPYSHNI